MGLYAILYRSHYILLFIVASIILQKLVNILKDNSPVPVINEVWWGSRTAYEVDESIQPFKLNISNELLDDLNQRLENRRKPVPPLEGIQHQYGFNTKLLEKIIHFWRWDYNWRLREKQLNFLDQFKTNILGLDIHYTHLRPKHTKDIRLVPILLLHGWPDTLREFSKLAPKLAYEVQGDFAFEVIAPSIPGYGFSEAPVRPGMSPGHIAIVFKKLMDRLNHKKFYIHGGDFGAVISHYMAVLFPETLLGYHSNMCFVLTPMSVSKLIVGSLFPAWIVNEKHTNRIYPLTHYFQRLIRETGHLHMHGTKPDTIGVALNDSPVGLAAYILEKFVAGTNESYLEEEDGGLKKNYDYEDLIDNIMIFWFSGSMTTAMRLYAETYNLREFDLNILRRPVYVPTACARFENDLYSPNGVLGEIYPILLHISDLHGGHFAATQVPDILAKDIYSAVRVFEDYNNRTQKIT